MLRNFIFIHLSLVFILNTALKANEPDSLKQVNWIHLDPMDDSLAGISLNKAYQLLSAKPSRTVVVAIVDSGVDIYHDDLKDHVWINADEVSANGIDDDKNGYIDDLNGWNFIGGPEGDITFDTYELTREYVRLSAKYGERDGKGKEYEYWKKIEKEYTEMATKAMDGYEIYNDRIKTLPRYFALLQNYLDTTILTFDRVKMIESEDSVIQQAVKTMSKFLGVYGSLTSVDPIVKMMKSGIEYFEYQVKYGYNPDFDPRSMVHDDYSNLSERFYGNNACDSYSGMQGSHGTHVAGIVAAGRSNDFGIRGIADNVRIMSIRTVPSGDERDKDVANAIYYAVNNGAQVINMSFGKDYSPNREIVEKAIRYAEKKGVILVHAAGNDAKDLDAEDNFPTPKYIKGGKRASTWIEVGASSQTLNENLTARFSNYGKYSVDLFAPGVKIYSTIPEQQYEPANGTSMAAPVVTGVAALLMSYFPELDARQIRDILVKSTYKYEGEVKKPGDNEMVKFKDLSVSGGIVNAYEAVKMAMTMAKIQPR